MVKWPWISRLAFDLVCAERDQLRRQVDSLLDHTKRMDRNEHGLHEIPHEQREKLDSPPPALKAYINGFAFKGFRRQQWKAAYKRRMQGESWNDIMEDIKKDQKGEDHKHTEEQ